jgi:enamine deaminase RidA (YjgF/YER057c/UK114 family)
VQGQPLLPGFEAFQRAWGDRPNPPAITGLFVAGLAHPDFLVEFDAIAAVPLE